MIFYRFYSSMQTMVDVLSASKELSHCVGQLPSSRTVT